MSDLALRSVHTTNFPALLDELGLSLVVSTYQAGKLVLVRSDAGTLNTHFRELPRPMGVAADGHRLAVGTASEVWEMRNVPAVTSKLEPEGKHDACYLPRSVHLTGDIDIHEMAYAGDELWFVNTRFSCLCTLDGEHSFVPRWRPPFVTGYDLTDRCHLNGLGLRAGRVRYVTALGESDKPEGWRADKAHGGLLMDLESGEIIARGLSMPHSPRWYRDQLFVLESGKGTLSRVATDGGSPETVAELPGFTRGLDFFGPLAFIGLSQVRERSVFSALPVTERAQERNCGVWVVNLETGEVIAFLRFEEAVQEVFAVSVLAGIRFPELITADEELVGRTYVLPDAAMAEVATPAPVNDEVATTEALLARGNAAYERRDLERAAECYRECLENEPEHTEARYHLGVVELEREAFEEAKALLSKVIDDDPGHAQAFNHLGLLSQRALRLPEAIAHYRKAITLRPDFPDAHLNLGMALLLSGEVQEGFAESEWRWRTAQFTPFECPKPRWAGEDIAGKTILVHTEQGAGDALQFIRYLPLLRERCKRTLVVGTPDLLPLLASVEGVDAVQAPGNVALDTFDVHVALMSLPDLLGTTLETIPVGVPYLQVPEDRDALEWRDDNDAPLIDEEDAGLRVGIVWAGSPTHNNDHNRSCRLADFFPLLRTPGVAFYSLQKPASEAERAQLAALDVCDLGPRLKDFADMAAAIERLDLVVSVGTSAAHLAGALGRPVWTLLCHCPDWRWMLEREDTPWYPSMRLYRQSRPKQWGDVLERVGQDLAEPVGMVR